jgi:hypothetical protein
MICLEARDRRGLAEGLVALRVLDAGNETDTVGRHRAIGGVAGIGICRQARCPSDTREIVSNNSFLASH